MTQRPDTTTSGIAELRTALTRARSLTRHVLNDLEAMEDFIPADLAEKMVVWRDRALEAEKRTEAVRMEHAVDVEALTKDRRNADAEMAVRIGVEKELERVTKERDEAFKRRDEAYRECAAATGREVTMRHERDEALALEVRHGEMATLAVHQRDAALAACAEMRSALKYALAPIEVVARTGRVSEGGEQAGNRIDFEWARDRIRKALASAGGGQ